MPGLSGSGEKMDSKAAACRADHSLMLLIGNCEGRCALLCVTNKGRHGGIVWPIIHLLESMPKSLMVSAATVEYCTRVLQCVILADIGLVKGNERRLIIHGLLGCSCVWLRRSSCERIASARRGL